MYSRVNNNFVHVSKWDWFWKLKSMQEFEGSEIAGELRRVCACMHVMCVCVCACAWSHSLHSNQLDRLSLHGIRGWNHSLLSIKFPRFVPVRILYSKGQGKCATMTTGDNIKYTPQFTVSQSILVRASSYKWRWKKKKKKKKKAQVWYQVAYWWQPKLTTYKCFYYPGQENWDSHACQITGACMLERSRACTPVCAVVLIFLARAQV